ncbi:DUF397 domain-containing protein [Lentzea sp. NPDC006480]|uniref:DUF397 domain-containing protein n=1 Tax=Lentzea sp. NPDC006480 TaxID=3157176 RepID=UPI0033B01EC9
MPTEEAQKLVENRIARQKAVLDGYRNCVEVGRGVGIRDSKAPATHLPLTAHQWTHLLRAVKGS